MSRQAPDAPLCDGDLQPRMTSPYHPAARLRCAVCTHEHVVSLGAISTDAEARAAMRRLARAECPECGGEGKTITLIEGG